MAYSDRQIEEDVMEQLRRDNRLDSAGIVVTVHDGEVTLSGTVLTYTTREIARSEAWMIPGVRRVNDRLQVRRSAPLPADRVIERNVRSVLRWSRGLDETHLRVSCKNGSVTLEGTVDAAWKKLQAEKLAGYVVGARKVLNRIDVAPPPGKEPE